MIVGSSSRKVLQPMEDAYVECLQKGRCASSSLINLETDSQLPCDCQSDKKGAHKATNWFVATDLNVEPALNIVRTSDIDFGAVVSASMCFCNIDGKDCGTHIDYAGVPPS